MKIGLKWNYNKTNFSIEKCIQMDEYEEERFIEVISKVEKIHDSRGYVIEGNTNVSRSVINSR